MTNSLSIDNKEFPEVFILINQLAEQISKLPNVPAKPSIRQIAADVLKDACKERLEKLNNIHEMTPQSMSEQPTTNQNESQEKNNEGDEQ